MSSSAVRSPSTRGRNQEMTNNAALVASPLSSQSSSDVVAPLGHDAAIDDSSSSSPPQLQPPRPPDALLRSSSAAAATAAADDDDDDCARARASPEMTPETATSTTTTTTTTKTNGSSSGRLPPSPPSHRKRPTADKTPRRTENGGSPRGAMPDDDDCGGEVHAKSASDLLRVNDLPEGSAGEDVVLAGDFGCGEGEGEGKGGEGEDGENAAMEEDDGNNTRQHRLEETSMNPPYVEPANNSEWATKSAVERDVIAAMMVLSSPAAPTPRHTNGSNIDAASAVSKRDDPQQCKTQFLATENCENGMKDFCKRVSFNGDIIHRMDVVPSIVASGLESHNDDAAVAAPYPASSHAMNVDFPTMAPPMFPDRPRGSDFLESKSTVERREKKSKKRGRDKISKSDTMEGVPDEKRGRDKIGKRKDTMDGVSDEIYVPKKKISRSRKSDGKVAQDIDGTGESVIGEECTGGTSFPSKNTSTTRTPSDFAPRPKRFKIATDDDPNRICNPLLSLPRFPDGIAPPIEDIPQGGELWNLSNLHFHDPDTYPIGYLARVLGFDVPEDGSEREGFGRNFDPTSVERSKDRGEHDAMAVPERGSFYHRVWKGGIGGARATVDDVVVGGDFAAAAALNYDNGMQDDLKLTYSDPLYVNILSSYRGYNDDDFKNAGKGFVDELSTHCLDYAKERGVLPGMNSDGVSFRFCDEKDEQALTLLAEKCRWNSHPKHDLATCLRSQSYFFIIAESSSGSEKCSPIAFLQYRFCWYKAEEKKRGSVSTEKISELVIFIDNLVYEDADSVATDGKNTTTCSLKDLETAKVLLVSLALVHACRANIWYGMMESPSTLVQFFTKYFRMINVGRGEESNGDAAMIPLVLDIKKCHFKYAILLLEESLRSTCQRQRNDACAERMIVKFCKNASNTSEATPQICGEVFPNSNSNKAQLKKAQIRLVRQPGDEKLFSVSTSAGEREVSEAVLNPIDSSVIDGSVDWKVVKLFPIRDAAHAMTGETGEEYESRDVASDIFLAELKKKQAELLTLESSIETDARGVLSKAYNEHTAFVIGNQRAKRIYNEKRVAEYQAVQRRLEEAELAWQAQLDQDMDAVCDVCFDGEVAPENQIIFCDACNVAVHQMCYGIDQIPSGNYFCHTCTYFEIDKEYLAAKRRDGPPMKITRPPIVCELCPRRQGAFVQVQTSGPTKKAKWAHVSCAKWSGMNYVDNVSKDKIEDLTLLKEHFKVLGVTCTLCNSGIGALHPCRVEGCGKFLHLTCARSFGRCSVQHGENCDGFYDAETLDNPPWTLACPKHSEIDPESAREGCLSVEQLVAMAKSYPPEPVPPKTFSRMNGPERKEYLSNKDNLIDFFEKVMTSLDGAKCALCEFPADPSIDKRCDKCGIFSHADCADPSRGKNATCFLCRFIEENSNGSQYEVPQCHMCCHPNSGGPLVRTSAKPLSMKKWKLSMTAFQRSTFGNNKFCHALCGMWNPICTAYNEGNGIVVNCSNSTMSNGKDHVSHQYRCTLCGLNNGAKVDCSEYGCVAPGGRRHPCKFHITCARQAGLEVVSENFTVKCFNHSGCTFVLRARLEDLREIELTRFSGKTFKPQSPISWGHASELFHASVTIMQSLGWAWRWADWWVQLGDNWEPLLEPGQVESEMTEEELKIIRSDPESRCRDARQCRLAAFGAALRNRDYDKEDGDDQDPLERALTAIMSTKSLVGPLKKKEIEFFVTWLALAYRSKSPMLGFGDDKTPVASDSFCVHQDDGTPKYELGTRPLPGKAEPLKGVFEPTVEEVDDFLKTPVMISPEKAVKKGKKSKFSESDDM